MRRSIKAVLIVLVFLFSIFQAVLVLYDAAHFSDKIQTKVVEGSVSMCINYPPNITGVCFENINQSTRIENNTYFCQFNASSSIGSLVNYSYEFNYLNFTISGLQFDMSHLGIVQIWGNDTGVGRYMVPITVTDVSSCSISKSFDYYFNILDINDPPVLTRNIGSKNINEGDTLVLYFLNDYFTDLDGDVMHYTVSSTSFIVNIDLASSRVTLTSPLDLCSSESVYFTAIDEHNLSTESNMVTFEGICSQPDSGGSGGGGGSSQTCESEWVCKDWSRCFINGTQFRTCVDMHGCNLNELKQNFWRDCEYIATCYDGVQNSGELGIDCGGPCITCTGIKEPPAPVVPTCEDGLRNQGELGIDCGGPCPACKQVEVPGLLPEDQNNELITITMIFILAIGSLVLFYTIFRKELKKLFAKVAWRLTRRRRKEILLSDIEKKELLESIKNIELKVNKSTDLIKESDKVFQDLLKANRNYIVYVLDTQSFYEDELNIALKKIVNNDLKKALMLFIQRQSVLETSTGSMDKISLMMYVRDLRQFVLNTSNYDKNDYSFTSKEVVISGSSLEKCKALIYNSTIALEFSSIVPAKNYYFELLKMYELLSDADKGKVFSEISKLFSCIKYGLSWAENKD